MLADCEVEIGGDSLIRTFPRNHSVACLARHFGLCCALFSLSCASGPSPSPPNLAPYGAIAILPFQTEGFLERYGSEIADQLTIEILVLAPAFPVVERTFLDRVLEERKIRGEAYSEQPDTEGLIPADLFVTGSVAFSLDVVGRPLATRQAHLSATVRAIEASTGKVVWGGRFSETADELLNQGSDIAPYRLESDAELREEAIEKLARSIAKALLGPTAGGDR